MGDLNVATQFIAFEINTYSGNAIDTGDCHANSSSSPSPAVGG